MQANNGETYELKCFFTGPSFSIDNKGKVPGTKHTYKVIISEVISVIFKHCDFRGRTKPQPFASVDFTNPKESQQKEQMDFSFDTLTWANSLIPVAKSNYSSVLNLRPNAVKTLTLSAIIATRCFHCPARAMKNFSDPIFLDYEERNRAGWRLQEFCRKATLVSCGSGSTGEVGDSSTRGICEIELTLGELVGSN